MKINKSLSIISSFIFMVILLVSISGCNKIHNQTRSASRLIVQAITGTDLDGNADSTTIFSDVITSSGTTFNDTGVATLSAVLMDPNPTTAGTYYEDIIVDQINIEYTRSDGLNVPGIDVPYGFTQRVYVRIPIGGDNVDVSFVSVQHTAKLESPLVELIQIGQEKILKLEARVTFYGKDGAGKQIEPVVGTVSIWCANFADNN